MGRPLPVHYRDCQSNPAGSRPGTGCNCDEIERRNRRDAVVRGLDGITDTALRDALILRPDLARRLRAVLEAVEAPVRPVDFAVVAIDYGSLTCDEFDRKYPGWASNESFINGLYAAVNRRVANQMDVVPDPEC